MDNKDDVVINDFVRITERVVNREMKNNYSHLRNIIYTNAIRVNKGGLFYLYYGLICYKFRDLKPQTRDKIDNFLNDIFHYSEMTVDELYKTYKIEKLEKERCELFDLLDIKYGGVHELS